MKLSDVKNILEATVYAGEDMLDMEVRSACGSDLMSDVLAFAKDHAMLLTGLQNLQVIRTAEMIDIEAVVFVRGKVPGEDAVKLAEAKGIVLMTTEFPMFVACGMLYSNGLSGGKAGVSLG